MWAEDPSGAHLPSRPGAFAVEQLRSFDGGAPWRGSAS